MGTVHADTLVMTWVVMLAVLLFCWGVGKSYTSAKITERQTVFEGLINFLSDLSLGTLGRAGEPFVPFFVALFIYIFCLDQVGFLPLKLMGFTYGGAPTADLNTTVAYALLIFVMIQVVAVRKKGLGFYKHLAKPLVVLLPINILEESLRPVVMAARLFFNILVGEILLYVISQIIVSGAKIGWFDLSLAAAFTPILIQFLNFFVGSIQAFVFTLLAIVYLSMAVGEEH